MTTIIDRRTEPDRGRYGSSKERFLDRNKQKIKEAIDKAINDSSIENAGKGGIDVTIPRDGIREPHIHHGKGGKNSKVLPGNKEFSAGDRIKKPNGGGGGGGGNGPNPGQGKGQDDFVFSLSEEEFFNYLYDDCELPNLSKKSAEDAKVTKPKRSGFVNEGAPNKMDLVRSKLQQISRHVALKNPLDKRLIIALEEQRRLLIAHEPGHTKAIDIKRDFERSKMKIAMRVENSLVEVELLKGKHFEKLSPEDRQKFDDLEEEIIKLAKKKSLVPEWDDMDLRFRHHEQEPQPTTKAAMFCLMDVSGSMDEEKKANAKVFYMLLHKFLKRNYERVDLIFIRHTDEAEEVDEKTFFYDTQSGGTKVSSVVEKMEEIRKERYPAGEWNVYGAQASDGDNIVADNDVCANMMRKMLPEIQAYFYTELPHNYGGMYGGMYNPGSQGSGLWNAYKKVADEFKDQMFLGKIKQRKDIWPVFKDFFKKREQYDSFTPRNAYAAAAFRAQGQAMEMDHNNP